MHTQSFYSPRLTGMDGLQPGLRNLLEYSVSKVSFPAMA